MSEQNHNRPRVGWALGGGGARGLVHIGILKVLTRADIPVDAIAGTSMGGLVAALFACGISAEQMEAEIMEKSKLLSLLKLVDYRPAGWGSFFSGERVHGYFRELVGEETGFTDAQIPLALTAVDINTGLPVLLNEGSVADAMRATMSVPGVFAPVPRGPMRLVDGGVLNNVPVDVARSLGVDCVVAVDVNPNFALNAPGQKPVAEPFDLHIGLPIAQTLWHAMLVMMSAITESHLAQDPPDLIIRPDIPVGVSLFSGFDKPAQTIAAGTAAAEAALPYIRQLLRERLT